MSVVVKTYDIATQIDEQGVNHEELHAEIVLSDSVENFDGITTKFEGDDEKLEVLGDSIKTGMEATLDSVVQNHDPDSLMSKKVRKHLKIDRKTSKLIGEGFDFDSKKFSLSPNAQMNWSEIHSNKSEFTYPLEIATIESDTYNLSEANVDSFWTAAKDKVKQRLDSGRALKKAVFDAADKASVDAVTDNR